MQPSPIEVRRLAEADAAALERFLAQHAESSMFLRSNLRSAGLTYRGRRYEGDYFGAFDARGAIQGVIAHYWNGNILVQAPEPSVLRALSAALRDAATRPCAGVLGPDQQADAVIADLGLAREAFALYSDEHLYTLELSGLRAPAEPPGRMRPAGPADAALLQGWLRAYEIEAIHREEGPELDEMVAATVANKVRGEDCWLLEIDGTPVCLSAFNARLPDIVQVGPVWTPPEQRSRGFARALVAMTLQAARDGGVEKAILFTANPPAIKAYEAIGFRRSSAYRLAILQAPVTLRHTASPGEQVR